MWHSMWIKWWILIVWHFYPEMRMRIRWLLLLSKISHQIKIELTWVLKIPTVSMCMASEAAVLQIDEAFGPQSKERKISHTPLTSWLSDLLMCMVDWMLEASYFTQAIGNFEHFSFPHAWKTLNEPFKIGWFLTKRTRNLFNGPLHDAGLPLYFPLNKQISRGVTSDIQLMDLIQKRFMRKSKLIR